MKLLLIAIVCLSFTQSSIAGPIKQVDDKKLLYMLGNLSLMKEIGPLGYMESIGDLSLRMWVIREEYGECDGSPESCPKEKIFIVISSIDMFPEQRLYEVPAKHGWVLSKVANIPKTDKPNEYFVLKMIAKEPSSNSGKEWWKYVHYAIKVNLRKAIINEIGRSSESEYNHALEVLYPTSGQ